jgi:hypothetical protein
MYSSCENLILQSPSGAYPHTSVWEIHDKSNVPLEKLVIGKPARKSDVYEGEDYMTPDDEAACLERAKNTFNWTAGAMFWEFHGYTVSDPNTDIADTTTGDQLTPAQLISTVRGNAFPIAKASENGDDNNNGGGGDDDDDDDDDC